MARDRAGLSQQQLADRIDKPRSTIARWESGLRLPSLESVEEVVEAAGLDLVIGLAQHDSSLEELTRDQLEMKPAERLRRLLPAADAERLTATFGLVAELETPLIVIGPVAAVLQGATQRPPGNIIEVVPSDRARLLRELEQRDSWPTDDEDRFKEVNRRWQWRSPVGVLAVSDRLSGAGDYPDLRRDAVSMQVENLDFRVASRRDLLRLAEASPDPAARAYAPGLQALLDLAPST